MSLHESNRTPEKSHNWFLFYISSFFISAWLNELIKSLSLKQLFYKVEIYWVLFSTTMFKIAFKIEEIWLL